MLFLKGCVVAGKHDASGTKRKRTHFKKKNNF